MYGYFLPGVRHLTAFVAGTSKMPFAEFAVFSLPGGLIWSGVFTTLGFLGKKWSQETERIRHILEIASIAAMVLLAIYLLLKKRNQKNGR